MGQKEMKTAHPEWHNEDRVEAATREWLQRHGWELDARVERGGADISGKHLDGTV